jgi:hypothetical protein
VNYKILYTLPLLSALTTFSLAQGEPTNLKALNIQETSAQIAFQDNTHGEDIFRIIIRDDEGKEVATQEVGASAEAGKTLMRTVNGLKVGTNYTAVVSAYVFPDDITPTKMNTSRPLAFKTAGESGQAEGAINLKAWRIKETSVKIAFEDRTEDEDIFKIIVRDDEGVEVSHQEVIASPQTGKTLIERVSGLKAGTNYTAVVSAYQFPDDFTPEKMNTSKILVFTTKGESDEPVSEVEGATNLKAWRIKENSVKIAFEDRTEGEDIFKISIKDEEGQEVASQEVIASSGTGKTLIQRVNGLTAGTNYTAVVSAYVFHDDFTPTKLNSSKPLLFRTKGENTQPNGQEITELKTWSIKATSAKIAFLNNIVTSGVYSFVNADTEETMTLNSQGIISIPNNTKYSIGKMIELTPETHYRIQVVHLSTEGAVTKSKIIEFTTKN